MAELSLPSPALLERLTGEVGFDDRLAAVKMEATSGDSPVSLYSLEELVDFLRVPTEGRTLLIRGGHQYIPYVDPAALRRWVERALGDTELAAAIAEETDENAGLLGQLAGISRLVRRRWEQVVAAGQGGAKGARYETVASRP